MKAKIRSQVFILFSWTIGLLVHSHVHGHQPGNSNLQLRLQNDQTISGEYHIANVDVVSVNLMLEDTMRHQQQRDDVGFDKKTNGVEGLAWITITAGGEELDITTGPPRPVENEDGVHTMIPFTTGPAPDAEILVTFSNFFQFDPQHTVNIELETGHGSKVGIITIENQSWSSEISAFKQFTSFTVEGIWHIWIGIDHILFLVALLLPSVLHLKNGKWTPVSDFKEAFYNLIKVVTAFTIAHSVTLTLAALDVVSLPSKWVETVIAISVVLAALNNIFPLVSDRVWMVALGFGFIHGFGFANVLADLELPTGTLAIALFSFNVGVELGQIAIVLVLFPIIFLLRARTFYQPIKLRLGSTIIALIACGWIIDRMFELEFMPF